MLRKLLIGASAAGLAALAACSSGATQAASAPVVNTSALPATTTSAPPPVTSTAAPATTSSTAAPPPKVAISTTRSTHSATPATTAPPAKPVTAVAGTPCTSSASACVDISRDEAWLIKDGKVVYGPVSITSGKRGHRTPIGSFTVIWKDIDHKSKEFDNAPMPYSVFFYPGDAFHTGSLRAESHGCIHLANSVAKRFYRFLSVGDGVQVRP